MGYLGCRLDKCSVPGAVGPHIHNRLAAKAVSPERAKARTVAMANPTEQGG